MKTAWDRDFLERSPLFEPLRASAQRSLCTPDWPTLGDLRRALAQCPVEARTQSGARISFVPQAPRTAIFEDGYEPRIHLRGEVQVRGRNWHDLMNALVWMTFPRAKAALNARHYRALLEQRAAGAPNRGKLQDALTLFDEGGVIVVARDPALLRLIESFEWKRLFWQERTRVVDDMRFYLFGHAIYEKALAPFAGITARGLLFEVEHAFLDAPFDVQIARADALAAALLQDGAGLKTPRDLAPVPILGIPGWCAENARASYYDNRDYFRAGRSGG